MKILNRAGMQIEVCEERGLLLNGKPPEAIEALGSGWYKASSIFCRVKRPKMVGSCRKRKKALMHATKRFRFSMNFKQD